MARDLGSMPPEILLQIAEFLDQSSLLCLVRTARFLHVLLWKDLYNRDVVHNKSIGLIRCIRAGNITAVSKFITAGADVNAKVDMSPDTEDFSGHTLPLATAVVRNQRQVVQLLLEHGADVCARMEGVLCYSVRDHAWVDAFPTTPLSLAVTEGHTDIAIDLVRKMPNPDSVVSTLCGFEYTALEQAALFLRSDLVRQLLQCGADPNLRQPGENSVILHTLLGNCRLNASFEGKPDGDRLVTETVMVLLQYGADPFIKRSCWVHLSDELEDCGCGLTACIMGILSPYQRLRQHFGDLVHRQLCGEPACRGSRCKYGTTREDIPGHCNVYVEDLISSAELFGWASKFGHWGRK